MQINRKGGKRLKRGAVIVGVDVGEINLIAHKDLSFLENVHNRAHQANKLLCSHQLLDQIERKILVCGLDRSDDSRRVKISYSSRTT